MDSLRNFDITLQTKDGATILEAMLAPKLDFDGNIVGKEWRRVRGKPFSDAFRTGNNGGTDPTKELFFHQTDWSEGGLVANYEPGSKTYRTGTFHTGYGDLMRGIGKNIGSNRGNLRGVIGVALANPGFETTITSDASDWTDIGGGGTVDIDNTNDPRTTLGGSQHLRITADGANQGAKVVATTHTVWRGAAVTFGVYLKRAAGSTNGVKLTIDDGVGTTDSSTVTSSTYTYTTVTRTVNGSSTKLEFIIQSTGSDTFDADDATIFVGTNLAPTPIAVISDGVYCAFGKLICQLETGTANKYRWEPVHVAAQDVTDLAAYKDRLYAGQGYANGYLYSDSGDGTTWNTASAGTTVDNYAKHFVVVGNSLWKSQADDTVRSTTTDPSDGNDWGSSITVGTTDELINRMYPWFNSLWIGKEDGYWSYLSTYDDGTAAAIFINQKPGFVAANSTDNFASGTVDPEGRYVYVSTGRTGLMRHDAFNKERIGHIFTQPQDDLGGRIGALAHDKDNVFVFADDQLYALPTDEVQPRPMTAPSVGLTGNASVSPSQANTGATSPGTTAGPGNHANATASDDSRTNGVNDGGIAYVTLQLAGADVGNVKSINVITELDPLDTDFTDTFGSSSDVWGTSLTAADINNSTFGVEISGNGTGTDLIVTNFGFAIPSDASIDGVVVSAEWQRTSVGGNVVVDHVAVTVYYTEATQESSGIYTKQARVVPWTVSSVERPHLLGIIYGLDSTDSGPYNWTDSWALPLNASTPDLDDVDIGNTADFIEFGTWGGGEEFADVMKAIDSVTVRFRGMDGTETVSFKMGVDGQASDAVTVGTFATTDNVQTLFTNNMTNPETQAIGKSFNFRLETSSAPKGFAIESVTVRAHATQVRERQWEFTIEAARSMTNQGLEDVSTTEKIIDLLEDLENSAYPIELVEDLMEQGSDTTTTVDIVPDSIEEMDVASDTLGATAGTIKFRVRERKTS